LNPELGTEVFWFGMTTNGMTISGLAEAASVNVETIRYYERRGLIKQPRKPGQGWRRYDQQALRTVQFVKRAQALGFSLDDVEMLLRLRTTDSPRTCARVAAKAREKIAEVDTKLRDLTAIREVLVGVADACPAEGPGSACPILDTLDGQGTSS